MDSIGKMNQRVTIRQTSRSGVDAAGSPTVTTTDIGPLFAAVEFRTVGSDEKEIANQNTAITAVRFTIRNNPKRTIALTDVVLYRGLKYEIRSVLEADPNRAYLLLETEQMGKDQTA